MEALIDLGITLGISLGVNLLMFVPAYRLRTDKLTDISYSVTFVAVMLYGFIASGWSIPNAVLAGLIVVWAVRLGGFLFVRVQRMGRDTRFDGRRESARRFLSFWILQALTVWIVSLPATLFFSQDVSEFSTLAYIGIAIWAVGLIIETFADRAKYHFKRDPANRNKPLTSGLWKYSRHPNYFGEMVLWIGIFVYTLFSLPLSLAIIAAVGPIYLILLIYFVSGVAILEKVADQKWGNQPAYREYKANSNVLVPIPRFWRRRK